MRIGIIGAGMIGSTMAKLWADAGHDVKLASRHPEALAPLVSGIGPKASAGTASDAAAFGDVVMITVPLKAMPDLARELDGALARKIVLDTNNAYERRDAAAASEASGHPQGSAAWDAAQFPGARWVKAFNSVYFKTLESEAHRAGDRVGIPLASDDAGALEVASGLVRDAGFDPVVVGGLARGKEFEPETPPYNTGMSGRDLRAYFEQRQMPPRLSPPRVVSRGEMLVAGLSQRYERTNAGMTSQWERFAPYIGRVPHQIAGPAYGVMRPAGQSGAIDYITGVEVSAFSPEPKELAHVRVEPRTYAVFWHAGHVSTVSETWREINDHGLADAKLRMTDGFAFERYDQRFDPKTGKGGFEIWVAVEKMG